MSETSATEVNGRQSAAADAGSVRFSGGPIRFERGRHDVYVVDLSVSAVEPWLTLLRRIERGNAAP